jgi:hypothetical protein
MRPRDPALARTASSRGPRQGARRADSDRGRKGLAPPRPPNRTCGFPAYGSPVGGFLIGSVSLHVELYETSSSYVCKEGLGAGWSRACACFDAVTSADTMCSIHHPASACGRLVAFGFCAPSSPFGHSSALSLPGSVLHTSTFLPTFPPPGFASRASCGSSPQRYYAGSDSCRSLARPAGLSAYSAPPSEHPDPNHVMSPDVAFSVTSAHRSGPLGPSASPAVAGSPTHPAETGSSSYGLLVRLQLLPTPPRGDAVTLDFMRSDLA